MCEVQSAKAKCRIWCLLVPFPYLLFIPSHPFRPISSSARYSPFFQFLRCSPQLGVFLSSDDTPSQYSGCVGWEVVYYVVSVAWMRRFLHVYILHKYYGDDPSSEKSSINCDTSSFLSFIVSAVFFSSASFFASTLACFEATSLLCWDSIMLYKAKRINGHRMIVFRVGNNKPPGFFLGFFQTEQSLKATLVYFRMRYSFP